MGPRAASKALANGKEKAGYSLLLSPFLRSFSLPAVSPCHGPLRHAGASCVLSVGCLAWLPRVVPVGPYKRAGVLWCAIRRVGFSSHQVVLSVEVGGSPWGCCLDGSVSALAGFEQTSPHPYAVVPYPLPDIGISPCPKRRKR